MIYHVSDHPPYSFAFDEFYGDAVTPKPEPTCPHPDGHLFEQQPMTLLSYPPQSVWSCIREGCNVVRHVAQPVPPPRRMKDPR